MLFVTNLSFKRTISLHNSHVVVVFLCFENTCDSTPPTILWCGFSIPHLQAEIIWILYQNHWCMELCFYNSFDTATLFVGHLWFHTNTTVLEQQQILICCNSALFHLYRDTYYKYVPLATSFEFVAFSLTKFFNQSVNFLFLLASHYTCSHVLCVRKKRTNLTSHLMKNII